MFFLFRSLFVSKFYLPSELPFWIRRHCIFRDVRYIVPLGLQLWMFATPVVYPTNLVPAKYLSMYMLNPMAGIMDSYRQVILYRNPPNIKYLGMAVIISLISFSLAYCFFKKVEMKFADAI